MPPLSEKDAGMSWKFFWQTPANRRYFLFAIAGLISMFFALFFTLAYAELRPGIVIETWSGKYLGEPRDHSVFIFALTYLSIVYAISANIRTPVLFLRLLTAYIFMQLFRCLVLLAVPLDPPADIVPLNDPLLEHSFYAGRLNLKDLFFSGHVATICIVALFTRNKWLKITFWLAAFLAAALLVQQRVHYIADVLAAPLFAWIAYRISAMIPRASS